MNNLLLDLAKLTAFCIFVVSIFAIYLLAFGLRLTDANNLYRSAAESLEDGNIISAQREIEESLSKATTPESQELKKEIESAN